MIKRQIKVDEIQSIQAYLENYMGAEGSNFVSTGVGNDDSAQYLDDAFGAAAKSSKDLTSVVTGLNSFLSKVAGAFQKSDQQLKNMIDGKLEEIPTGTREQRQDYYVSQGKDSQERGMRRKQVEMNNERYRDFP